MNPQHTKSNDTLAYLASLKRQKVAGAAFEYSCIDTQVLDWVVQCVTGKSFHDAFSERVWSKIGAQADALIMQSELGQDWSPAGVASTLRDLARYGMIWTENSWRTVSQERIVPASLLEKIRTPWRPQIVDRGFLGYYSFRNFYGEEGRKQISHTSYQVGLLWEMS